MAGPASLLATRLAYSATQLPRVAWYLGHSMVMRQLSDVARRRSAESTRLRAVTSAPVPDRRRLYADMATLFLQDLANVEAGIYPLRCKLSDPHSLPPQFLAWSRRESR
jgi:hypothetical protein